jgi:hypothetical protein
MSTLEVTCGRCDKKFRVRAEFAGRSTRCPGCSAPLTISGARPAPPTRAAEPDEDRPRPRPRARDDEDDAPRRSTGDWKPVDMALGREQTALVFLLIQVICTFFAICLGRAAAPGGIINSPAILLVVILVAGPTLAAGAFGLMARIAALRAPPESLTRGTATASLLCVLAALGCIVFFGIALLMNMESQHADELPIVVAIGGLVVCGLAAVATFIGYVAQVGIARRSAGVSRAVGRTAIAIAVCSLALLGISGLYTLVSEAFTPAYHSGPYGYGYYRRDHDAFYQILLLGLIPLALAVILILYHRLLAAARRTLKAEPGARDED